MFKVTLYVMLLAIQSYRTTVLCLNPAVSLNYVKQAASNQASTNERFRSTSSYDTTPVEYVNDNERYDFTRMKIIHKIESSVPIVGQKVSTLIEKKTMEIKPDYNSMIGEKGDPQRYHKPPNADQDDKILTEFRAHGKCVGECQVEQISMKRSVLITRNDPPTSHRSDLKRMTHHHILNAEKGTRVNSELKDIPNDLPSSTLIGPVPLTPLMQDDESLADGSTIRSMNHRVRRQLRYIPASRYGIQNLRPHRQQFHHDISDSIEHEHPSDGNSAFLNSLLGVFDKSHPVLSSNVRPIKPDQVIITPPRYINDAKIFSAPTGFPPTSSPGDTLFVKNTLRNPSGFGESKRVLTTDVTRKEKQPKIIHDYFLPTVRPHTNPKISSLHTQHRYGSIVAADYPKNHQLPLSVESILSATEDLYDTPEILGQHESYKHHGKDTKYDRYAGNYSFEYHVMDDDSANEFGHQETRNEQITKGNYYVRLPDGRLQRVKYHVDDGGYHADVSYERNHGADGYIYK